MTDQNKVPKINMMKFDRDKVKTHIQVKKKKKINCTRKAWVWLDSILREKGLGLTKPNAVTVS